MSSQTAKIATLIILAWASAAGLYARAGSRGCASALLGHLRHRATPAAMLWQKSCRANAAAMVFFDSVSVSGAGIGFCHDDCPQPTVPQNGSGLLSGKVAAHSYYRLSPQSAAWGNAAYTQSEVRDIRYCDIIDYSLAGPYTLGDDTGGDLSSTRYEIDGGWTRSFGNWSMGLAADYRAETAHRSRDPRVRNIVSDLNIAAGASLTIKSKWIVGLDAGFTTYHQDTDVDFMNPANTIITQLYTGLGSVYNRFGGNTATESAHALTAFNVGFQLLPASERGIMAGMSAGLARCTMFLRGFNNISPAHTDTHTLSANIGWSGNNNGHIELAPAVEAEFSERSGTENLFGSVAGGNYPVIGSRKNYRHTTWNIDLHVPVLWHINSTVRASLAPSVGVGRSKERLSSPRLVVDVAHITPGASAGIDIAKGKTWGRASAGFMLRTLSGTERGPEGELLCRRMLALSASAGVSRCIGNTVLNLDIAFRHERRHLLASRQTLNAAVSINF